jgi:hypothetical protein
LSMLPTTRERELPMSATPTSIESPRREQVHRRGLWLGLLPWIGVILFAVHAVGVFSGRPDGWQQDVVQLAVVYMVGVAGLGAGISHLLFARGTARSIGWQPSPFQWEVGWADVGFGVAGLMAASHGPDFWLAVIVVSGVFRIGCGIGHIREVVTARNFAINNTAILVLNFAVPVFLYLLWRAWA